jgi:hypothetical protein
MTKKEFLHRISGSKEDVLGRLFGLLEDLGIPYCVIGGLAVNAYAEPVVSLDLDLVVLADRVAGLLEALPGGFKAKAFPNSLNLTSSKTDLRIQIQTDPRYQAFLPGARKKDVLGYRIPVARIEDVLKGKAWAALDPKRRPSKRQKDLSDILRLVEVRKDLAVMLPADLKKTLGL